MAKLSVNDGLLTLQLSGWERLGAVHRGNVTVPMGSIVKVERLDNARDAIRGMRAPGTGFPGVIALGRWRTRKTVDFVAVSRNNAGYVVMLEGESFDRLVVSSDPVEELDRLR